jgi:hypothetical protein
MTRTVELPEELVSRAESLAASEHVSLEEFLTARLAEQFADLEYLRKRAARASSEKFKEALRQVPDVEPSLPTDYF